jgi:purine-binding chemotaxis protein CheW
MVQTIMNQHFVNCRIGQTWYGIAIEYVVEVLHMVALTELTNTRFLGVLTLREQLLPIIDLRQVFGSEQLGYTVNTPLIALQCQQQRLGILVDETDTVLTIPVTHIAPFQQPLMQGIVPQLEPILLILDIPDLIRQYPTT